MEKKIVLTILEQCDQGIRPCSFELLQDGLQLAKQLDGLLYAVLPGSDIPDPIPDLEFFPADQIILMDHPEFNNFNTELMVEQLGNLIQEVNPAVILASATPLGKDFTPRLAVAINSPIIADCVMVEADAQGNLSAIKPTHQENFYTTYSLEGFPAMISLRPGILGIEHAPHPHTHTFIRRQITTINQSNITQIAYEKGDPKTLDLREADLIISGGSGVSDHKGWSLISKTADLLGASIGGSRPAVDQGFVTRDRMVGQTGKSVKTRLYLAAGISGVYYHLRGVDTDNLVAINTDKFAPIFNDAKLGIVGNLHEILPAFNNKLESAQSNQNKTGGKA
ncbi:MAG: electron transfer flavoprotein subunit alpha/FixB family protein [Anaerolineaceae bacterium]|nr:electron transfer flavoprotein subunit alpha/FixB family protein [Anaerolineaceae bacterium]